MIILRSERHFFTDNNIIAVQLHIIIKFVEIELGLDDDGYYCSKKFDRNVPKIVFLRNIY